MTEGNTAVEVLLVEDSAADAELTIEALKRYGITSSVVWVRDGSEALDFLFATGAYVGRDSAERPKVIILDLRMPRLNGIEFLRVVKSDEALRRIPVVVLTASTEPIDIGACYKLGARSYITKPVSLEGLDRMATELGLFAYSDSIERIGARESEG